MTPRVSVDAGGRRVEIAWPDGEIRAFAARWLYDQADEARDPVSGQRRHGASALATAGLETATADGERLRLRFSDGERSLPLARLREAVPGRPRLDLWVTPEPIQAAEPIRFDAYLTDDAALAEALERVARFGLVLIDGAGDDPDAVEKAVARFGFIRETNYGRLFDVRVEPAAGNLAFTEQALDLHTDNPYRDPVPTLQLLHALRADASGRGETLFVDGFAHAEALRREAPGAFARLAREPVRFTFTEASGARWSARLPVLETGPDGGPRAIRFNHRAFDPEPADPAQQDAWYEAYVAFHQRLHAPSAAFARRLAPGELVIFDNRRILHGRRAHDRTGARWLRGAYADIDGLYATLTRLSRSA